MLLEVSAALAAGLFAGASVYINLVEHPARMECGVGLAVAEFAPSYRRAAVMQGALAAVGFASAAGAWLTGPSPWWLVGGVCLRGGHPIHTRRRRPDQQEAVGPFSG